MFNTEDPNSNPYARYALPGGGIKAIGENKSMEFLIPETAENTLIAGLLNLNTFSPEDRAKILGMPSAWIWNPLCQSAHVIAGELFAEGLPVDLVTMSQRARSNPGAWPSFNLAELVFESSRHSMFAAHVDMVIDAIRDGHHRRSLRSAAKGAVDALESGAATSTIVDGLTAAVGRLGASGESRPATMREAVSRAVELADDAHKRAVEGRAVEFPSSLAELRQINPYVPGRMVVIAGRPGMGKTAFAIQEALSFIRAGKSVMMFSLEMQAAEIAVRVMAIQSGLRMGEFLRGNLSSCGPYRDAIAAALPLGMIIDDSTGGAIEHIARVARMYQTQGKCDAVIIDHIGLVAPTERGKGVMREQQVAHISNTIKRLAKQLSVPVLTLAQMNRQSEGRDNKRPMLSDLRESGAIEQDADIVIFPFRKGYHDPEKNDNSAEIMILKNRHGMERNIVCEWSPDRACYVDLGHRAGHAAPDPFDGRDLPEPP